MGKPTDEQLVRIMREEYSKILSDLVEDIDMHVRNSKGDAKNVIAPELRVRNKKTGYVFTVDSVSPRSVTLRSPDGELISVNQHTLEDEYEL